MNLGDFRKISQIDEVSMCGHLRDMPCRRTRIPSVGGFAPATCITAQSAPKVASPATAPRGLHVAPRSHDDFTIPSQFLHI
jgi:hypothetical protein